MDVTIPRLNARGLETDLGIDGRMIAFDRTGTVIGPVEVVVVWANREARGEGADTVEVIGIDGDLLGRPGDLTAEADDRFMLDGALCEVTRPAIVDAGVATAGFRLSTGGA